MIANINDRTSIERAYPREEFDREIGRNSEPKASVLAGVRILRGIDGHGDFEIERASRHAGEAGESEEAVFLSPFLVSAMADTGGAASPREAPAPDASDDRRGKAADYEAFLDRIVAAAKSAPRRASPGPGEERLQGLRQ